MKRQAEIKKNLSTVKNLLDSKKAKLVQLQKEIAYLEMREATGTANKVTLDQLIERQIETHQRIMDAEKRGMPVTSDGYAITAGGAMYDE
jgi:hypothetical protein